MTPQVPNLYSLEAEQAVIGSLLIDPEAYNTVGPILTAADFSLGRHRVIFEAVAECARARHADLLVLCDILDRQRMLDNVGGMAYLTELIGAVPSSVQVTHYANIVRDFAIRRAILVGASDIGKAVYQLDAPTADVQAKAEALMLACRRDTQEHRQSARQAASLAMDAMRQADAITTGLPGLDKMLGGLQPGVYIVAARPSMGKSSLLCQMITGMALAGSRVMLFTLEMSATQVMERMAASMSRVPLHAMKQHQATPVQTGLYMDALGRIADLPITLVDKADVRTGDILAEARRQQIEFGQLAALFVDGLWLMQPSARHATRLAEVGEISRDMKRVQRETGLPIIMAHQLSRACEGRGDRRPILSDLRETGDVEQDADVVLMLFREGYYNPKHKDANVMELWVRKNRLDGPAGEVVKFYWNGPAMRCGPLERSER